MTVYVTHSNREFSDHTSWSEIMIFSRALEEHGIDVRVARTYGTLDSMRHPDTLIVFCSGLPAPSVSMTANRQRTIAIVQDLSWRTIVPRHDVLLTGCMTQHTDLLYDALGSIGVDTTLEKMLSFPFGAVGTFDQVNRQNLDRGIEEYQALGIDLDEIVYLGSAKDDRTRGIANMLKHRQSDRLSWIGNVTREYLDSMIDDESVTSRIDLCGWIRPNMSVGLYRENAHHIVAVDQMAVLKLDYNRPYEMSYAGARDYIIIGASNEIESFKQTYPWIGDYQLAQTHAQKMVEDIDWSMFE